MVRIYGIDDFEKNSSSTQVYVNRLNQHVRDHSFTNLPHKHDFYFFILVTKGSGSHQIDFVKYPVKPGSVFLMQPGQMHFWKLSKDIDGFVFFHSKEFYEAAYTHALIHHFKFFKSFQSVPYLKMGKKSAGSLEVLLSDMFEEFRSTLPHKLEKLHSLINLVYINISRIYAEGETNGSSKYLQTFSEFEELIEENYVHDKLPSFYASKLNITEKHLNRICRDCVNKTSTQLIADRVILEAKRLLSQRRENITEISFELGFNDPSYFVRFFKKHVAYTPLNFQEKYFQEG